MNGRLLNENNDIYIQAGGFARSESLRQKIMRLIGTTLRTWQGECFVDYSAGIPWFDEILGKSTLFLDEISAEIKDKILEIDGVEAVEDIMVTVSGRNVSGKYKVKLASGTIEQGEF